MSNEVRNDAAPLRQTKKSEADAGRSDEPSLVVAVLLLLTTLIVVTFVAVAGTRPIASIDAADDAGTVTISGP
jgi:hypothetical protein